MYVFVVHHIPNFHPIIHDGNFKLKFPLTNVVLNLILQSTKCRISPVVSQHLTRTPGNATIRFKLDTSHRFMVSLHKNIKAREQKQYSSHWQSLRYPWFHLPSMPFKLKPSFPVQIWFWKNRNFELSYVFVSLNNQSIHTSASSFPDYIWPLNPQERRVEHALFTWSNFQFTCHRI